MQWWCSWGVKWAAWRRPDDWSPPPASTVQAHTSISVHLIALLLTALPYAELSMCVCAHMSCLLGGKNTSIMYRGGEGNTEAHMIRSQINPSYECGIWMKVKVAKWCWKKWNGPFLMHIYDKQCEIMQKNQWKGPNFQIQCFYNERSLTDRSSLLKTGKTRETKT